MHEEGLTPLWDLRRAYWAERPQHEARIREGLCSVPAGIARHVGSRPNIESFNPDLWMDEIAFLRRPGMDAIQLDLIHDYQSNLRAYPEWQAYLRERRPPRSICWTPDTSRSTTAPTTSQATCALSCARSASRAAHPWASNARPVTPRLAGPSSVT